MDFFKSMIQPFSPEEKNKFISIAGIKAVTALFKNKKYAEQVKKTLLFGLKTVPTSLVYFKVLGMISENDKSVEDSVKADLMISSASALFAMNISSKRLFTPAEKKKLFAFFYVLLKRLGHMFLQHNQGWTKMESKQTYFITYALSVLKDLLDVIYLHDPSAHIEDDE